MQTVKGAKDGLAAALAEDRAWLVRLCARLAGNAMVAEELAQEVLIEAWRHAHKLTEPSGRPAWLAAIARNVYLRWRSTRGRRAAREVPFGSDETASDVRDDTDLEVALERAELAELLDRALARLPPATRAVLVARYLDESPHADIASLGTRGMLVEWATHATLPLVPAARQQAQRSRSSRPTEVRVSTLSS